MGNISANTLFHFTANQQSLLSILENGFYVRYSLENYESLISGDAELVIPLVSFCDIPLAQIKNHSNTYGTYAIGLTKAWGMRNKINPVIYSYPESTTADILNQLVGHIDAFFDINLGDEEAFKDETGELSKAISKSPGIMGLNENILELQDKLGYFLKYIKPYEGKFFRDGAYLEKKVRFYEEREWRFIPDRKILNKLDVKDSYKPEYYTNPVKRRAINMKLAKYVKLQFEPNDIRFIIVNQESEIPKMLKHIEDIFEGKTPSKDLKLLGTRLISLEQIIEDF